MVKQANKEKRQWIRAKRILSIQHRLSKPRAKGSAVMPWRLSTTQDMSIGGLAFYSDFEYRANEIVDVHVVMSGILDIFKGSCKVIRVEKKKTGAYYLVAVKFIDKKRKAKTYRPNTKVKLRSVKRI
ncbi:MAG: PilZ domain-containing protein [Candidatus Zapsychrus exili]|nr:PilZ domain-containing protein [Candidatus Zapsychrus exili]